MSEEFWQLTPLEYYELVDRWQQKQNRTAIGTAQLTALLVNCFSKESSEPADPSDFLPFPPPRKYLSEEASMVSLDLFFGAIVKKAESNGSPERDLA